MRDELIRLLRRTTTRLATQDRALANAREASTALSRAAVEREQVRLYLEARATRSRRAHTA